jgi:hypothetical protein
VGQLLFQANYPLDALEVDKPVVALYSGSEPFIVAPQHDRGTVAENTIRIYRGIRYGHRAFIRAAMAPFCCDNRTESVHINIQLQKEGAQAW